MLDRSCVIEEEHFVTQTGLDKTLDYSAMVPQMLHLEIVPTLESIH